MPPLLSPGYSGRCCDNEFRGEDKLRKYIEIGGIQDCIPDQANIRENKISIFSPIATALIGYRVSDEIEWVVPAGLTRIRIEEILYQPEAAGDYDQ